MEGEGARERDKLCAQARSVGRGRMVRLVEGEGSGNYIDWLSGQTRSVKARREGERGRIQLHGRGLDWIGLW